jgi:hypothetical protein
MIKKGFIVVSFIILVVIGITTFMLSNTSSSTALNQLKKPSSQTSLVTEPLPQEKFVLDEVPKVYVSGKEPVEKTPETGESEGQVLNSATVDEIQAVGIYREFPTVLFDAFDGLKLEADGGDANAAFILGELLQKCALEPKTQTEYTETISKNFGSPIEIADQGYKLCKGITKEQLALSTKYLEQAAKSGDIEAMLSFFRATPLEIENYSDHYQPNSPSETKYLESLFERKVEYLDSAVNKGNIDAAIALGLSYSDDQSPTATGYDIEKALENLMIARLMDPKDGMQINSYIEYLAQKTPIHTYESVEREANKRFRESLENQKITYIDKPTQN